MDAGTKQDDRALKYYLRLNRIFAVALTLVGAAFTVWHPTFVHIAGLFLVFALTLCTFFAERLSSRGFGFVMLAVAALFAIAVEFVRADWGMEPYEFGVAAVSIGGVALGLILANKKTAEIDARVENGVGILVLLSLLAVAAIVEWRGAPSFAHPAGWVFVEALGALADVAGERWKGRLAWAAILPIAVIVANHIQSQWPRAALGRLTTIYRLMRLHSHSWMLWAPLFAGVGSLIRSLSIRRPWRSAVIRLAAIVAAIWFLLVIADATFG
jgi:hypothetical protein